MISNLCNLWQLMVTPRKCYHLISKTRICCADPQHAMQTDALLQRCIDNEFRIGGGASGLARLSTISRWTQLTMVERQNTNTEAKKQPARLTQERRAAKANNVVQGRAHHSMTTRG